MKSKFEKEPLVTNLLSEWEKVTPADRIAGARWYPDARQIVGEYASAYRYHDTTVACVISAISPQCEWTRNLIIADDLLAGREPSVGGALHVNLAKAKLLRDEVGCGLLDPADVRMSRVFKSGPKVTNFALNLSGDNQAVTVDTHAIQAALSDPLVTVALKANGYKIFAKAYQDAAGTLGIYPAIFQAIIWHSWKRQYPTPWKIRNRAQWSAIGEY